MFSQGHLIWIAICFALIAVAFIVCLIAKPSLKKVLKTCLILGVASEVIKVLSTAEILPMVDAVITEENGRQVISYVVTGRYTPYLGKEHLPLELCSLFLFFMLAALLIKNEVWKKRLYALMFASGTIGGLLGIVMSSIAGNYDTTLSFFTSPRSYQFFLYHAMVVFCSLYIGFGKESGLSLRDWKTAIAGLVLLDLPTFYMNSVLSSEVYVHDKPVGVTHSINYFSSYVNPLGLALTEKWQWIAYLAVRAAIAVVTVFLLYLPLAGRGRKKQAVD